MFQFFPTFAVSMKHIVRVFGDDYCYLQTEQLQPQLHDSTNRDIRFFVMPFKRPAGFIRKLVRKVVTKVINIEYHRINKMICMEDVQVCENLQTVAHQARGDMRLSAQEERVGWFEEAYAKYVLSQINQKDV